MENKLVIYQPNYNVLPGTNDYYIERDKFIRMSYIDYCISRNYEDRTIDEIRSFAYSKYFPNCNIMDSAIRNWEIMFYKMVITPSYRAKRKG